MKTIPYDGSVPKLHAWLTDSLALGRPGGQEERGEKEFPHDDAETLKPRRGGGTLEGWWSTAEYIQRAY